MSYSFFFWLVLTFYFSYYTSAPREPPTQAWRQLCAHSRKSNQLVRVSVNREGSRMNQ